MGTSYRGDQTITAGGYVCQAWNKNTPKVRRKSVISNYNSKSRGLGDHNKCRNPDNSTGGLWCYTVNPNVRYDWCYPINSNIYILVFYIIHIKIFDRKSYLN